MPISYKSGKSEIKEWLHSVIKNPDTVVLDLGCGLGTYGELIDVPCIKIGVDAVDYSKRGDWKSKYDKNIVADIRNTRQYLAEAEGKTTICILGDVLEHLTVEDSQKLLSKLEELAAYIMVAVPYMYPQESKNSYEVHRQPDLTHELFMSRYPGFRLQHQVVRSGEPVYGYYVWCGSESEV